MPSAATATEAEAVVVAGELYRPTEPPPLPPPPPPPPPTGRQPAAVSAGTVVDIDSESCPAERPNVPSPAKWPHRLPTSADAGAVPGRLRGGGAGRAQVLGQERCPG